MARYRGKLSYVGTFFHGWQVQENTPRTVQAVVERALTDICATPVRVHAAGRTDAGVHAEGQVVHFDAPDIAPEGLQRGVNPHLPWDVRFLEIARADPEFHARFDARAKRYLYRFGREAVIAPRDVLFWAPLSPRADAAKMAAAAAGLEGEHDFFPFSTGLAQGSTVRRIFSCQVQEDGPRVTVEIVADGFLRGMARAIAGTLADIGRGTVSPDRIPEILRRADKSLVRAKARPRGLTLAKVFYEDFR